MPGQPDGFDPKVFLPTLPQSPGVYQMFGAEGEVLYVGKAKNLKNRVSSYFSASGLTSKTLALVSKIARIQVTITRTEIEALLLEQNLIKQNMPPYNILLRDDKSYPYIFLSDGEFPRLACHRGAKRDKGSYFGPFPNAHSVRESLALLQRMFKVRQCEDSYFSNRSRACLQYQIKRCTGPCVGLVTPEDYAEQVWQSRLFLEGKSQQLVKELASRMEVAAASLEYEKAAEYRDQIRHLQKVSESQFIEAGSGDLDIVAVSVECSKACVHLLFVRDGRILGSSSFYPSLPLDDGEETLLPAFLAQFYLGQKRDVPEKLVCAFENEELLALSEVLSVQSGRKVQVVVPQRGRALEWLQLAQLTARQNLKSRLALGANLLMQFENLQEVLGLGELPRRLECFDISHSSGEATVASCVVFDHSGSAKKDYRRFNINNITSGDDYAAMGQALTRRFSRLLEGEGKRPDILLIDGGKGQVAQAARVLEDYGLNDILVVGVAKGVTRKPGLETLVFADSEQELVLPADSPALHLIQQVRDEAHRFAVSGHTLRRDKARRRSALEDVPGIGAHRRKALLHHFGSVKSIMDAPVRELVKVPGISQKIAEDIYAAFHKDSLE